MTFKTRQRIAISLLTVASVMLLLSSFMYGREDAGRVSPGTAAPWRNAGYAALATGAVAMFWASRAPDRPKRH